MDKMSPLTTRMCSLLAGLALAATPALPAETTPAEPETPRESADPESKAKEVLDELEEVIIYGTSGELVAGLFAESELGEQDIAAYGANSVGELLAQVAPNVDNSAEGPVILINGKPATGLSVNDLPPEAIQRMQVLPPQAAGAIGESPTRRVINVELKPRFRQGTAQLTGRAATAGRGGNTNGNYNFQKVVNNNIQSISVSASKTEPLLEAHRDIQTQRTVVPYDLTGNVVSWPVAGGEIDPDLSAAAGMPVTVAGVPAGNFAPGLDDFTASANSANASGMGRYRTLLADSYNFGITGNMQRQLPKRASLSITTNFNRSESSSLTGASPNLLHVPSSSPYSPFDSDVGVARYLGAPLQQETVYTYAYLSSSFNMQLGKWRLLSDASFNGTKTVTDSERRIDTTALQAGIDAGTVNPFAPIPADLQDDILSDRARSRSNTLSARVQLAGALFDMPAGKANANVNVQWQQLEQRARTFGTNNVSSERKRQHKVGYVNVQLPLLGKPQSQGFGMGSELNGTARDVSATGTLYTWGLGLNGRYGGRINMRIGYNREKQAPTPSALNDPIIIVDSYRTYDFLRDETVLVRYISGGNPDLRVENRDIINVSGQGRPFKTVDFNLNAQYTRTMYHDPMNSLPPPSAEVQAAFPDRFRRDADGRLYEIDARAVNFIRTRNEQFRWGANYRKSFGVPAARPGVAQQQPSVEAQIISSTALPIGYVMDGGDVLSGAGWRLNFNFTHQWQVAYKRLMREGLPETNLLSGGAGFGTPQPRHRVQGTFGLARNGTGMQLNSNWTGSSHLDTGTPATPNRLDFSSTLLFDLQAFTNLGTLAPANKLLQGVRISLNVVNLLDSKPRVQDQNGVTPQRYQPYLMNPYGPLGRTVALSFRKAFN
jgi:iron complex outermembrane recepter protein